METASPPVVTERPTVPPSLTTVKPSPTTLITSPPSASGFDLTTLTWETITEPFSGDLEQVVNGLFLNRHGEVVAWGRDQEWINSDWGDATTSFWVESADGSWSKTRIGELGTSANARGIADDGETYVAVGDVGGTLAAWHSLDGATWTRATVTPESSLEVAVFDAVAAGAEGFMSVGEGPQGATAWFSADGTTWADIRRYVRQGSYSDVVASPDGGFVVVGVDRSQRDWDATAWKVSSDGRDWQAADPSDALAGSDDDELHQVWAYDRGYVALGAHGDERLTCDDGSALIAFTGSMVAYGPCWWHQPHVYTSTDGHHWRRFAIDQEVRPGALPSLWEFSAIEPWGDGLIAIGSGADWKVRTWVSDDGAQWTAIGDPLSLDGAPIRGQGQSWAVDDLMIANGRLVIGGAGPASDGYVMSGKPSP